MVQFMIGVWEVLVASILFLLTLGVMSVMVEKSSDDTFLDYPLEFIALLLSSPLWAPVLLVVMLSWVTYKFLREKRHV